MRLPKSTAETDGAGRLFLRAARASRRRVTFERRLHRQTGRTRLGFLTNARTSIMDSSDDALLALAERLIDAARRHGADEADAAVVRQRSHGAEIRLGAVESVEASESDDLTLRVFVGRRVASVSADAYADVERLAERAVAMAKVSPEDPYAGLADEARMPRGDVDLDLFDGTEIDSARLVEDARIVEDAARSVEGVTNSTGASASAGWAGFVLVTSRGFSGTRRRSGFSRSVGVIAGSGTGMERDHDFDSRVHFADLDDAAAIGRRAGERVVRRLSPQKVATGRYPIVFDPRVSRGLVGHLVSAINGAAIARGTSFLKNRMGELVLPETMTLLDDPLIARRGGSRLFDGEGVPAERLALVENGRLASWILDGATARELGLATNGRAARGAGGPSPSASNVLLNAGPRTPAELLAAVGNGIYVTELIGSGANLVTGDYSRGASGFLIENGELTTPISELTIAGNLTEMLLSLEAADDLDDRFQIVAPTLSVGEMMVAGR